MLLYQALLWIACLIHCVVSHSKSKSKSKSKDGPDTLDLESLAELDKLLDGTCFSAQDGLMYDAATLGQWIYGKPPLNSPFTLVEVASVCDIARVMKFVKDTGAPWRIRSGGHTYSGHSTCAGHCIVMDVSLMKQATFDASRNLWLFGAGATLRELAAAGAFPHGVCGDIGIAGHVQGGGIGILSSKLGLTLDHMVGAWVMLENGNIIHATTTNKYKDLLWAMRGGGGGNWGVLLLMEFRPKFDMVNDYFFHIAQVPYPISDHNLFKYILKAGLHDFEKPLLDRQGVDPTYDYTPSFYLRATTESYYNPNLGPTYFMVNDLSWTRLRTDVAAEARFGAYINNVATPRAYHAAINLTDSRMMYNMLRFPACVKAFPKQAPFIARTRLAFSSLEQNDAFLNALTAFYNKWRFEKTAFLYFIVFPAGRFSKYYDADTSYFRGAFVSVDLYAMALSAAGVPAAQGMVADFESMIAPTLSTRQYMNEFSPDDILTDPLASNIVTRLYGGGNDATYLKLRDIKKKYDKKNFFSFPGSIEPSTKKVKEYQKMKDSYELNLLGTHLNISGCPLYKDLNKKVQKAQAAMISTSASTQSGISSTTTIVLVAVFSTLGGVLLIVAIVFFVWRYLGARKLGSIFHAHAEGLSQQGRTAANSTVVEAGDVF